MAHATPRSRETGYRPSPPFWPRSSRIPSTKDAIAFAIRPRPTNSTIYIALFHRSVRRFLRSARPILLRFVRPLSSNEQGGGFKHEASRITSPSIPRRQENNSMTKAKQHCYSIITTTQQQSTNRLSTSAARTPTRTSSRKPSIGCFCSCSCCHRVRPRGSRLRSDKGGGRSPSISAHCPAYYSGVCGETTFTRRRHTALARNKRRREQQTAAVI